MCEPRYAFVVFGSRKLFNDPVVELTCAQESAARRAARSAAAESRRTLRTARGQYKRYRAVAGSTYLDWGRWRAEYLAAYKGMGAFDSGNDAPFNSSYGAGL